MNTRGIFSDQMDTQVVYLKCYKCKLQKMISAFNSNARMKRGLSLWCKGCHNAYRRARHAANPKTGNQRLCVDGKFRCTTCNEWQAPECFYKNNNTKCGISSICKSCERSKKLAERLLNPERYNSVKVKSAAKRKLYRKNAALKKMYGITLDQYNILLETQGGKCATCGCDRSDKGRDLCVDHNHKTGKVRGLLCGNCNRGIGYFKEDIQRMESAIAYLKRHKENT